MCDLKFLRAFHQMLFLCFLSKDYEKTRKRYLLEGVFMVKYIMEY